MAFCRAMAKANRGYALVALGALLFTGAGFFVNKAFNEQEKAFWQTEKEIRRMQPPELSSAAPFPRKISCKLPLIERNGSSAKDSARLAGVIGKTFEVPFPRDLLPRINNEGYQNFGQFICTNIDTLKMNEGGQTQSVNTSVYFSTDILGYSDAEQQASVIHEARHCNAHIKDLFPYPPEVAKGSAARHGILGLYDWLNESYRRTGAALGCHLASERDAVKFELRFLDRFKLMKARRNDSKSIDDADELRKSRQIAETTAGQMGIYFLVIFAGALAAVAGLFSSIMGSALIRGRAKQA